MMVISLVFEKQSAIGQPHAARAMRSAIIPTPQARSLPRVVDAPPSHVHATNTSPLRWRIPWKLCLVGRGREPRQWWRARLLVDIGGRDGGRGLLPVVVDDEFVGGACTDANTHVAGFVRRAGAVPGAARACIRC